MRFVSRPLLVLAIILLFSGCTFIGNAFTYRDTAKTFVTHLLREEYDKCLGLMALDHPTAAGTNLDTFKKGLANFRQLVVTHFGDNLNYTFMSAEKKWSTNEQESTGKDITKLFLQFDNEREFGVFELLFYDKSRRILNIRTLDVKAPVPDMAGFWVFGLMALIIPAFNIYMIIRIRRSKYKRKWPKYLALILLNVPTVTYNAVGGLSVELLSFQFLLGLGFKYMGYLNSAWSFGLPIGGLYLWWQLKKGKDRPVDEPLEEPADSTLP